MKTIKIFVIAILVLTTGLLFSQNVIDSAANNQKLVTKIDGVEYIGTIISDDGREILIETENLGKIYIPKSEIKSISDVTDAKNIVRGEYRQSGPFTTRYAFTSNAHPINKGENYAMLNLYGPEIHFALMDNLSIGLMSTWIASPMVLAVKYSIPTGQSKVNYSVGTLMGTSGYLNTFRGWGGLHWASLTIGDRMNNVSISGGYAYITPGFDNVPVEGRYVNRYVDRTNSPITPAFMFSVAGIFKVGTKASFVFDSMGLLFDITEYDQEYAETAGSYYDETTNTWIPAQYTIDVKKRMIDAFGMLLMPGFRFQKTENRAFQISLSGISLFTDRNQSESIPFPMISWYYRF